MPSSGHLVLNYTEINHLCVCRLRRVLVTFVVYLIAGFAYKTRQKGTSGVDSIPNIEFWRELPVLVKVRYTLLLGAATSIFDSAMV